MPTAGEALVSPRVSSYSVQGSVKGTGKGVHDSDEISRGAMQWASRASKNWVLGPGCGHLRQVMKPRRATVSHRLLNKVTDTSFSGCVLESIK